MSCRKAVCVMGFFDGLMDFLGVGTDPETGSDVSVEERAQNRREARDREREDRADRARSERLERLHEAELRQREEKAGL